MHIKSEVLCSYPVTGISMATVFTAPMEDRTLSLLPTVRSEFLFNNRWNGRAQLKQLGLNSGLNC